MRSRSEKTYAVQSTILRAIIWAPPDCSDEILDAIAIAVESLSWAAYPDALLLGQALERLTGAHAFAKVAAPIISSILYQMSHLPHPVIGNDDAFSMATALRGKTVDETILGKSHVELSAQLGLPANPADHTPQSFAKTVKSKGLAPAVVQRYLESSRLVLMLRSRGSSLKPMASALRSWAAFCDATCSPHFPIAESAIAQFASTCREPGTFKQYAQHLKAACDFAGHPTAWYHSAHVTRSREGLKRAVYNFKGPRMALTGDIALRLGKSVCSGHQYKFFCMLSWVFLLRASSEASGLVRAEREEDITNMFKPVSHPGVIGLVGGELVIRVRSRKNRIGGDTIARSCACNGKKGVIIHVPACLCPVHALWPWVERNTRPGQPLFDENIAARSLVWLKIALEARDVPNFERYTLHSLRRGAAQALIQNGGDLATLLRAGGWRGSAFRVYLDMIGVENMVVTENIHTLLDIDAGEE